MNLPAISVIIPMFNAEKYLADCLTSILAQSFTNFEVVIVDDCSTDNSVEVIKSFAPQFGERLKLVHMKKNSGSAGEPRNKGLKVSLGEYVFFMDADDLLVRTGLEEMYTLAKKFNADTVYCERYLTSSGDGQEFMRNLHVADDKVQTIPPVDMPMLETDDMAVRINKAIKHQYWLTPWLRLVSRNLLIENEIKFPSLIWSEDVNWTFKVLFCSKRFLRIPNPCYIWRENAGSLTTNKFTPAQTVSKRMDRTIRGLKDIDDFMAGLEFFKANPAYRYLVIKNFIESDFAHIFDACANESMFDIYNIFREKFGAYLGEHDVLVAGLCTFVNTLQKICRAEERDTDNVQLEEYKKIRQQDQAYIAELEKFIGQSQQHIAALEDEIRRLKERSGIL